MQKTLNNALTWFEIPVRDLDRAQRFYERMLGCTLRRKTMGPHTLALFPHDDGAVGGCLLSGGDTPAPSASGSLVFLPAGPSLDAALERVQPAGGRVTGPGIDLPDGMGRYAHIEDSEGTRVGLHAPA